MDTVKIGTFPKIPDLSADECEELLELLTTNKAIAFDAISDVLVNREHRSRSAEVLRTLWSTDLDNVPGVNQT